MDCTFTHMALTHTCTSSPKQVCYAIASLITIVAMYLKVIIFLRQLKERRSQLECLFAERSDPSGAISKRRKHQKRFMRAKRTVQMIYVSLLIGSFECLPLGVLQGVHMNTQTVCI